MKQYWPQHKVFLFGQAALFPKKLIDEVVDTEYLYRQFPNGYGDYFTTEPVLTDSNSKQQVKITDIGAMSRAKFIIELKEYLQEYQHGDLSTGTKIIPADFSHQQNSLVTFARNSAKTNRWRKTIALTDLWIDPKDRDQRATTFWEILLTEHLLEDNIELLNIDYEGTYTDASGKQVPLPFAEFRILPRNTLFQMATVPPVRIPGKQAVDKLPKRVSIVIEDNIIYARLESGESYRISRKLRTDLSPYKFINHVLSHPRTQFSRASIKIATESSDITELVRACGFDRRLKPIFFPTTSEQTVFFEQTLELTPARVKLLENHKWDKKIQSGKT